jgi:hypothetical protein
LMLPITLKRSGPFVQWANGLGVGSVEFVATFTTYTDQANASQHTQMFRHRRLVKTQGRHNVPHRALPESEIAQNLSSAGLGYRVESVGSGGRSCHTEKYACLYGNMSSAIFFASDSQFVSRGKLLKSQGMYGRRLLVGGFRQPAPGVE